MKLCRKLKTGGHPGLSAANQVAADNLKPCLKLPGMLLPATMNNPGDFL
jgi:hypothetical protein